MAKKSSQAEKKIDPNLTAQALAKAVADGDIVNFRLVFLPFSPARQDSTERFEDEKYAYLLPDAAQQGDAVFKEALALVKQPAIWEHVQNELAANRPAQMPSAPILLLADNAVRQEKFTSAAQAYELLRVRRRMQEQFYTLANEALDQGDIAAGVRGYHIASALEYDYAAFPEPLPKVSNYQTTALILHGEYPERPEQSLPMQEPESFLRTALGYLLRDPGAAARLEERTVENKAAFIREWVAQRDPEWPEYARRYHEAHAKTVELDQRMRRIWEEGRGGDGLADDLSKRLGEDARVVPNTLLGRDLPDGEWWQYLKELAYDHPAAALFVSRQIVGDTEILVPRHRADSPLAEALGLAGA